MHTPSKDIIVLVLIITPVLLLLSAFIVSLLFFYQKKQLAYENKISILKSDYENAILNTQLEIQEQTFQSISREIHDNINLTLTLAKLQLNTVNPFESDKFSEKASSTIDLISSAIRDLSNLSRSMNSDLIKEQGLLHALEQELEKFHKLEKFEINTTLLGEPIFIDAQKELFAFRIIQESLNNVLKHSNATKVDLILDYKKEELLVTITDNGIGIQQQFDDSEKRNLKSSGILNMQKRAALIGGKCCFTGIAGKGTNIKLNVPY